LKNKKLILRLIICLLFFVVLLGMSSGIVLAEKVKIGVSLQAVNCPFYVEMKKAAESEGKKLGADVVVLDSNMNIAKQLSDVEDLISQGCDVIMCEPLDPVGSQACVRAANEAGIPFISFDNTMEDSPDIKIETTITYDFFDTGVEVGRYVGKKIGTDKVDMLLINGYLGIAAEWQRKFGFLQGMAEYQLENYNTTYINVIAQKWGNWTYDRGLAEMEDLLSAFPDKKDFVVIAQNDTMALGALKAIEEAGRLNDLRFLAATGDAQKEGLEAIMNGDYKDKYLCSGKNWPDVTARLAMNIAVKIATGEQTDWPPLIHPKTEVVTKENVKDHYDPNRGF